MIFASDLDRTLIYSKKFIAEENENGVCLLETLDGREISYITAAALEQLKRINKKILFVPTTTRTIAQYQRIEGLIQHVNPSYGVVSNGGNILFKGEIDTEWSRIIGQRLQQSTPPSIIEKEFTRRFSNAPWLRDMIWRDGLFWSLHLHHEAVTPIDEMQAFGRWLTEQRWTISIQGSKIYFIPECVNKWDAVYYIKEKEKKEKVITAGDSYLDYCILSNAHQGFCASHGELKELMKRNFINQGQIYLTEQIGMKAAEEILDKVEQYIQMYA